MTTIKEILDRYHTINQNELSTVSAARYMTPDLWATPGKLPVIVPEMRRLQQNNRTSGTGVRFTTYSIEQICFVGQYGKGIIAQSIAEQVETIIEEVSAVYTGRLNLDYNGSSLVHSHTYDGANTPRPDPGRAMALIIFTHTVTTSARRTIGG